MSETPSQRPETPPNPAAAAPRPRKATMLFRIVGEHEHQSVVDGHTFRCTRQSTMTETGRFLRWSAFRDGALLKSDCRTLNEAKQLCRAAAAPLPPRPQP